MTVDDPAPPQKDGGNAETRARLVEAAIAIASSEGLDRVTYRSVGARAGCAHSLVRFYFGTREALLTSALERAAYLDSIEGHLCSEDVDSFASQVVPAISGNLARGMLQYDYLLRAVRSGHSVERVVALYELYQAQVAGTLRNVGIEDDDGASAALIFAALDGIVLQHSIYGSDARTERLLERLRDVLRLLRATGGSGGSDAAGDQCGQR